MKRKAGRTLDEARTLARAGLWDGAANRAYYAAYQAIVGEFEERGLRAAEFGRVDPRYPEKWPHWLVVANCRAVGLSRSEAEVVEEAERLRVRADYGPGAVDSGSVRYILSRLSAVLGGLGVTCTTEGDAT